MKPLVWTITVAMAAGCSPKQEPNPAPAAKVERTWLHDIIDPPPTYEYSGGGRIETRNPNIPADGNQEAGKDFAWLDASGLAVEYSDVVFTSIPDFRAAYPNRAVVDFDGSIWWNGQTVGLDGLEKQLAADPPERVALDIHHMVYRLWVYEAVWLLNEAGITPVVVKTDFKLPN